MAAKSNKDTSSRIAVRYDTFPAKDLVVDHRVQRDHLNKSKLNRMRAKYNRASLSTMVVSERSDGTLVLIDGQHRWTLVLDIEGDDFPLNCEVHSGLSLAEEAELFVNLNVQEAASPLDLHKARVTQEEPIAMAITKAASDHGWAIGTGNGRISAVKVLEYLFYRAEEHFDNYGGTLVSNTIGVVTGAWGHDQPQTVNQYILKAVGEFVLACEVFANEKNLPADFFDYEWLAFKMQTELKDGARGWLTACRTIVSGSDLNLGQAMRQSLHRTYNKGRRAGKLPDKLKF